MHVCLYFSLSHGYLRLVLLGDRVVQVLGIRRVHGSFALRNQALHGRVLGGDRVMDCGFQLSLSFGFQRGDFFLVAALGRLGVGATANGVDLDVEIEIQDLRNEGRY